VLLSFVGFLARGAGGLIGARWVATRAARTLPHVIDSVLLMSALTLAWLLRLNPASAPWLLAKVLALVVYIGLGMVALRPRLPLPVRAAAWLAALGTFGYIVSVAVSKSPAGFFAQMPALSI
jgi:uncharacterized membrane protein SirB2